MSSTKLGKSGSVVQRSFSLAVLGLVLFTLAATAADLPPAAPVNPGTKAVTSTGIAWSWDDQSSNESKFMVWTDPGAVTPSTLSATTSADTSSWTQTGLAANALYSFQVAAANIYGTSARTAPLSAWTLAAVPVKPAIDTTTLFQVAVGGDDGNPARTVYAIQCTTIGQWLQEHGSLGALPVFRTVAEWGSVNVTGLTPGTAYSFGVCAQNGAGVTTPMGPEASGTPAALVSVPDLSGLPVVQAVSAIIAAALTVGEMTQSYSNIVASGRVISQDPGAGTQVQPGLPVDLVVSRGPMPVTVLSLSYTGPNPIDAVHGSCVAITVAPKDAHGTVSYQWYRNKGGTTVQIVGQTDATLLTDSVCAADAGQYYCEGSDTTGTVVSEMITLQVGIPVPLLGGAGIVLLAFLTVLNGAVILRQRNKRKFSPPR